VRYFWGALGLGCGLVDGELAVLAGAAVTVTASGERSIAAQSITGVASTGDDATITR
jgi:hypothetical protein